jgi:hypothetical protein
MLDLKTGTPWETVTLTTLSRDKPLLLDMLQEAKASALAAEGKRPPPPQLATHTRPKLKHTHNHFHVFFIAVIPKTAKPSSTPRTAQNGDRSAHRVGSAHCLPSSLHPPYHPPSSPTYPPSCPTGLGTTTAVSPSRPSPHPPATNPKYLSSPPFGFWCRYSVSEGILAVRASRQRKDKCDPSACGRLWIPHLSAQSLRTRHDGRPYVIFWFFCCCSVHLLCASAHVATVGLAHLLCNAPPRSLILLEDVDAAFVRREAAAERQGYVFFLFAYLHDCAVNGSLTDS